MATFVLVHGGGHGGWCWQRLSPLLRAAGHDVYAPTLTGLGERAHLLHPGVDLDTHIDDIVGVLKFEGLTDAILVGHSYGGMVITGAADRALSRVGHLVYLDAAHPRDGEALSQLTPGRMDHNKKQMRVIDGVELTLFLDDETLLHRLGITDPEDIKWCWDKLTPHPWKSFAQPLRLANQAAVLKIPSTNINCKATLAARSPDARARATSGERVWEIDTGHDLMLTEPQAVAEMLLRVAAL
jgi:pimeloyl-ACP methyl ester carboxylesterase